MYIGRFVVIAPTWAGYRVSSRSFPDRQIIDRDGTLTVGLTEDAPPSDNPYISYNCVRLLDSDAVVGNGSHVDPIADKLQLGYPPRDALAHGLLTLDFERDAYDTPRIAGVLGESAYIGIVRRDALIIEEVETPTLVATYERDSPEPIELETAGAEGLAQALYHLEYEHPVCSAAVVRTSDGFETAHVNGPNGSP